MTQSEMFFNQRQERRVVLTLPVEISIGSQLTLQGQLKDISSKSAFIKIKHSVYLQPNDEVGFAIHLSAEKAEESVRGVGRISRIVAGEGFAVYFTKIHPDSAEPLKTLLAQP